MNWAETLCPPGDFRARFGAMDDETADLVAQDVASLAWGLCLQRGPNGAASELARRATLAFNELSRLAADGEISGRLFVETWARAFALRFERNLAWLQHYMHTGSDYRIDGDRIVVMRDGHDFLGVPRSERADAILEHFAGKAVG